MNFGKLTLKHCKYGWMLFSGPLIGRCFDSYGEYSESEVQLMRGLLSEGHTVIDVGANIGDLTLPLSRAVGSEGRVYAIESNSDAFNVLCANLALNERKNVKPINAFVSTNPDTSFESKMWGQYAYVTKEWTPPVIQIDQLGIEKCQLIKIDVDGRELEVLKSTANLIKRERPALYFENDEREKSFDLLSYVSSLNYDMYWHLAPISMADNFFGQPQGDWDRNLISLMVLALPSEDAVVVNGLRKIISTTEWPLA